jgi:hypothetical protein
MEAQEARSLIESLIQDDDLEGLEELCAEFNIFEVLQAVRHEIRHSNFLSWLLDPVGNHGLGDYFLKRFLLTTALRAGELGIDTLTAVDVDAWNLGKVAVWREWKNIDMLLVDGDMRFVCAIENKVDSGEHEGQLARYRETCEREFAGHGKKLFVYLTKAGNPPSVADYVPVSYGEICSLVEHILSVKQGVLGEQVHTFLSHYATMLRRHVMTESEIQELCRRIYARHRAALDLIYENRPDTQLHLHDLLMDIISSNPDLASDDCSKAYIRFVPKAWDSYIPQLGQGWTSSCRMLLFEFNNGPNSLSLHCYIGPGDNSIRERIYNLARLAESPLVKRAKTRNLTGKWFTLYKKEFLRPDDYEDTGALDDHVKKQMNSFLTEDLPKLTRIVEQLPLQQNKA